MTSLFRLHPRASRHAAAWLLAAAAAGCGSGYDDSNGGGDGGTPSGSSTTVQAALPVLAAGANHTCIVDLNGGVQCWGANDVGQLGNNSLADSAQPVHVSGLNSGVRAVTAGGDHSCALKSTGDVVCWGAGLQGQLGDARQLNSQVPVTVSGLQSAAVAVAAGREYTCALNTSGAVLCWGSNASGQLNRANSGGGGIPQARTALIAPGLPLLMKTLGAGGDHVCAARVNGAPLCWGSNAQGQLGTGSTDATGTAAAVVGLPANAAVIALAGGPNHSCALLSDGTQWCWGSNAAGELGTGAASAQPQRTAQQVQPDSGSDLRAVALGDSFTCSLTGSIGNATQQQPACWGSNTNGELGQDSLGTGDTTGIAGSAQPLKVRNVTASDFVAVAAGDHHACAIEDVGTVICWGVNTRGQLGKGSTSAKEDAPVTVVQLP